MTDPSAILIRFATIPVLISFGFKDGAPSSVELAASSSQGEEVAV